jgi:hypothetical protein
VEAENRPHPRPVRSLGDLVILLNPAFEASLYNNLIALASAHEITYPPNQPPVMAILTSKSDWATGLAFPAGRFLATRFEKTRPSKGAGEIWLYNLGKKETASESSAILRTIGHDDEYINYDLNYTTNIEVINGHSKPEDVLKANNVTADSTKLSSYVFTNMFTNTLGKTNYYACVLQPRTNGVYHFADSKPGNPFLNVAVDPQIMDGHSDIGNSNLIRFVQDFILFSRTNYLNMYSKTNKPCGEDTSKANATSPK